MITIKQFFEYEFFYVGRILPDIFIKSLITVAFRFSKFLNSALSFQSNQTILYRVNKVVAEPPELTLEHKGVKESSQRKKMFISMKRIHNTVNDTLNM